MVRKGGANDIHDGLLAQSVGLELDVVPGGLLDALQPVGI